MTLKPTEAGFDMAMAERCARLCAVSYSDDQAEIQTEAMDCGLDHISFHGYDVPWHDTECFLAWNDEIVFLVFRGTESDELEDVKADLRFTRKTVDNGHGIHRGFEDALSRVYDDILSVLVNLIKDRQLIVTGHSLGAALACIAASRMGGNMRRNGNAVYTYGAPRVGGKLWAKWFDLNFEHYRVVNCTDLVPRVPFFSMGFRHTGQLCYLNAKGEMIQDCDFWSAFKDRWVELLFGFNTPLRTFKDHSIYRYLARIRRVTVLHAPVKGEC